MTPLHWPEIDAATFERMGTALIKSMHPQAERIDGAGGDQGREIQIRTGGELEFYQLKSFTGRLDAKSGRRRQVERSLAAAAKLNPTSWALVVPIDPTPGELNWFDGLRGRYAFPLHWRGKNWLDTELATRPGLIRYFVHGGADEAVRLVTELGKEQAALVNGAPDALARTQHVVNQLNDLDPYYRFEITVGADGQRIVIIPKYPGAERDSPITAKLEMQFPDTPEGRLRLDEVRSAIEFGTRLTIGNEELKSLSIEAPAGLGGVFSQGTVVAEPVQDPDWNLPGRLLLQNMEGATIGALPVVFNERTIGTKGFTITAWDRTRTFRLTQRIDGLTARGEGSFEFAIPPDAYPGLILPVLRFLHRMRIPNKLVIEVNGELTSGHSPLGDDEIVPTAYLELIEALDRIQAATTSYFAIPEDFTQEEAGDIMQADRLLRGEAVPFTWTTINATITAQAGIDVLLEEQPGTHSWRTVHPDYTLKVADHDLHLGQFNMVIDGATVANLEELRAAPVLGTDEERTVTLVPAEGRNEGQIRLGPAPENPMPAPAKSPT